MKKLLYAIAAVFVLAISVVSAASVEPVYMEGNPDCEDLGFDNEYKIDPPAGGIFFDGAITTILDSQFDWSSTFGMDAVIAKGGPNANVYYYDPASFGDTDLTSPTNPANGKPYDLSHMTFCWDDGGNDVPEFGVIAAMTVLGGAGYFIYRKRK